MDLVTKYRLIGASIWLGLLIIIVPSWYNDPVNFQPDGITPQLQKSTLPVIEQPYRLPPGTVQPLSDKQQQLIEKRQQAEQQKALLQQDLNSKAVEETEQAANQSTKKPQDSVIKQAASTINSTSETAAVNDQAIVANNQQWLLRLSSYPDIKDANQLLGELDRMGYNAKIKFFRNSKTYSVRIGPYISYAKAEKDKLKLDRILRTNGQIVSLP